MEMRQDTIRRGSAGVRDEAAFGSAFAWELPGSNGRSVLHVQHDWDRLPWLPEEPHPRHQDFDFALPLWVFAATFLVASAAYWAGRASLQPAGAIRPTVAETLGSELSLLTNRFMTGPRSMVGTRTVGSHIEQLPQIDEMSPRERQRVAIEMSFAETITSAGYDSSPEANAPY
jgi:hypothetical protein